MQQISHLEILAIYPPAHEARVFLGNMLAEQEEPSKPFLPSEVLEFFFRALPQMGAGFYAQHTATPQDVGALEKEVSDYLFEVYKNFTAPPSPRDVLTDVFAELEKRGVEIAIPRSWVERGIV